MPFIPHSPEDTAAMLKRIGVSGIDELFADIRPDMRPKSFDLPLGLSEHETIEAMERLAAANPAADCVSFLGGGVYDHAVSKAVDALTSRGEFYTAYTPYQPEAAQGTLQAIFEYQSAMCRLMDMDVANASVYDGGTALFEAAMLSLRATKRRVILVDEAINPLYRIMLGTLTANVDAELRIIPHANGSSDLNALKAAVNDEVAALMVQNPTFFGTVHDYTEAFATVKAKGGIGIISVAPVMAAVLKSPGEMGADVAVADGQTLGMAPSFGGPYLGIMTCSKEMVRQFPGRIVGRTTDLNGEIGYVLTLQAREQHIRRAKATSNICSNQALCALRSLIHVCLLGPEGLTRTAELSMQRAREAAAALIALPGVKLLNNAPYGQEFAVVLPKPAAQVVKALADKKILAGIPLGLWYKGMDNVLLTACTEKTTPANIAALAAALRGAL